MKEATDSRSARDEMHWKIIQQRGEGRGGRAVEGADSTSSQQQRAHAGSYLPIPRRHQLLAALLQGERRRGGRKRLKRRMEAEDVSRHRCTCFES